MGSVNPRILQCDSSCSCPEAEHPILEQETVCTFPALSLDTPSLHGAPRPLHGEPHLKPAGDMPAKCPVVGSLARTQGDAEYECPMNTVKEKHARSEKRASLRKPDVEARFVAAKHRTELHSAKELAESLRSENEELRLALEERERTASQKLKDQKVAVRDLQDVVALKEAHSRLHAAQDQKLAAMDLVNIRLQTALQQSCRETKEATKCAADAVRELNICTAENEKLCMALQQRLGGKTDGAVGPAARKKQLRIELQRRLQDVLDCRARRKPSRESSGSMESIEECTEEEEEEEEVASLEAEDEQRQIALEQSCQETTAATWASEDVCKIAAENRELQSALGESQQETAEMMQGVGEVAVATPITKKEQPATTFQQCLAAEVMASAEDAIAGLAAEDKQLWKALQQSQRENASLAAESEKLQEVLEETEQNKATMKVVSEEAVCFLTCENEDEGTSAGPGYKQKHVQLDMEQAMSNWELDM